MAQACPARGLSFSREELKKDLRYHYRRYGAAGKIILLDFRQFFPSVSHEVIYGRHRSLIPQEDLRLIGDRIVGTVDGGYGLPLGVEPSQAEMISFTSPLDNFIKCQLEMKCAGHYMCLTVNASKTRIVSLAKPFRYCKVKYTLTETGRVVTNGNRKNVKRARKKFRAFYKKVCAGEMTADALWTSVNGVFAYFDSYDDHARVLRLRRLFYSLFGFSPERIENFRTSAL